MNWYYVDAGQQAGPVDDAQLDELLRSGKIQPDTLVWREGLANWLPYAQAKAPTPPPAAPAAPPVSSGSATETTQEAVCSECGRIFGLSEMIRHKGNYICAGCKPVFMQKLSEGMAGSWRPGGVGTASMEELLARDYEHDLGGYFSRGWETFKNNAGIMIAAAVLVYLPLFVSQMLPYLSFILPINRGILTLVSWILSIVFTGPLLGGLWIFYLKKVRGLEASIGDAFSGFGPRFGQLLLGNFIPQLLAGLCMVPMVVVMLIGVVMLGVSVAASGGGGSPVGSMTGLVLFGVGGLLGIVGFCGTMYFSVCWVYTLQLVADKGMDFWAAMGLSRKIVRKHWWMNLLVVMVIGLVGFAGALACGVGLLVSGPVAFAVMACAYDKLFGDLAQGY